MARILAVDYGLKRCGIAVTDPMGIIATALTTVATHQLQDYLTQYFILEEVEALVMGYPLQMDGTASETLGHIKGFAKRLQVQFPDLRIHFQDERFTSKDAQRVILASGINKTARKNKSLVDKVAAVIILQEFMVHHV